MLAKERQMNKLYEDAIRYKPESPDFIKSNILDPIEYTYHGKQDIDITIKQPEYTSVCPMTGLPDYGCITVTYRPDKTIIELKSFKYYLLQYRNVGIFYEHLVNRILDDLVAVLLPKWMKVTGDFTSRGGVTSSVTVEFKGEK
jgi:7-cyano-7-deazaguanine reductase